MIYAARAFAVFLLGVVLYLLLQWIGYMVLFPPPDPDASLSVWRTVLLNPYGTAARVLPAVIGGYLVKRFGWVVGVFITVLGSIASLTLLEPQALILESQLSLALAAAILGAVGGAAGQLCANRLPSNNSFKPKPLRGSA